jgi:ABC-type uncharacterized transport system substrate-binding protein
MLWVTQSIVAGGLRRLVRRSLSLIRNLPAALVAAACMLTSAADHAQAHPHVWVTMRAELLYAADGSIAGVRHAWTFDDMFSVFALEGIAHKKKGVYTRAELAPLAEVNVTSLKEYGYFTRAWADHKKVQIFDPVDYWLAYADSTLTLHFTLPFKTAIAVKALRFEIYDPTWFVDFTFAEKDPVALVGAKADCKLDVQRPTGFAVTQSQPLSESFFNSLSAGSSFGAQFANKVNVQCP